VDTLSLVDLSENETDDEQSILIVRELYNNERDRTNALDAIDETEPDHLIVAQS